DNRLIGITSELDADLAPDCAGVRHRHAALSINAIAKTTPRANNSAGVRHRPGVAGLEPDTSAENTGRLDRAAVGDRAAGKIETVGSSGWSGGGRVWGWGRLPGTFCVCWGGGFSRGCG